MKRRIASVCERNEKNEVKKYKRKPGKINRKTSLDERNEEKEKYEVYGKIRK